MVFKRPVPVSRARHGGKRLLPTPSFAFAAAGTVLPVYPAELGKAALEFPIGFVESAGAYGAVLVLGLEPGQNLFVAPDGRWLAGYVPAVLRGYPFLPGRTEAGGPMMACIDEESGLLSDRDGQPLFTPEGEPAGPLAAILPLLAEIDRQTGHAAAACAALARHGAIAPWPLQVQPPGGTPRTVAGLFRIDEARLTALSDEAFLELRRCGALALAYAQLLSMGWLARLEALAAARARQAAAAAPPVEQGLVFDFNF